MDKKIAKEIVEKTRLWFEANSMGAKAVVGVSGGKDSTVVATLLAKALGRDQVVGVMLPQGLQSDIEDSRCVCKRLGIHAITVNIGQVVNFVKNKVYDELKSGRVNMRLDMSQFSYNLPPRIRMSTLYAVAQAVNGRVIGTGNAAEIYVGYYTLAGDGQSDFNPLSNLFVDEVLELGKHLGIPKKLLLKPPADGLCGKTDEERLGFKYASVKQVALKKSDWLGSIAEIECCGLNDAQKIVNEIETRHRKTQFKRDMVRVPTVGFHRDVLSGEIIGVK